MTAAPVWRVLDCRFLALARRVRIADPERSDSDAVRIGRAPHDRWLQVRCDGAVFSEPRGRRRHCKDGHALRDVDEPSRRYQRIRESLVLTCILAQADYTTWLEHMKRTVRLRVPPIVDVDDVPLQRKFLFVLDNCRDPSEYEWNHLKHLLGDGGYDEVFQTEFAHAAAAASAQRVDMWRMRPIAIHLEIHAATNWSPELQTQMLRGIVETIGYLKAIEETFRQAQRASPKMDGCPPIVVFKLESISLHLDELSVCEEVCEALQCVLDTGVRVTLLALPLCPDSTSTDSSYLRLCGIWSRLVLSICGIYFGSVSHGALVERVTIKTPCAASPFIVAFLSALRYSRGLAFVTIDVYREFEEANHLWLWLAFSLFCEGSTSSIQGLHLENFELRDEVDEVSSLVASEDPVGQLWMMTVGCGPNEEWSASSREFKNVKVIVVEGAECAILTNDLSSTSIRTPCTWEGEIVFNDSQLLRMGVLLPGYGFCVIDRQYVTEIAHPVSPSIYLNQLRTLVLDLHEWYVSTDDATEEERRRDQSRTRLVHLLLLIGQRLSGIDLHAPFLICGDVEACLRSCPVLKNLRLSGMTMESLQFLVQYYESGQCRISSLDFRGVGIEPERMESFLRQLVVPGKAQRTLKRLRLDDLWCHDLSDSFVHSLLKVMGDQSSLKLMHLYLNSFGEIETLSSSRQMTNNRQLIIPHQLPLCSRLALISALRLLPENSSARQLDQYMIGIVFQFAAQYERRIFVFECRGC